MSSNRRSNFDQADAALGKELGITQAEVEKYRDINKLAWHEENDLKTMQLIPTEVNKVFGHSGGVGEANVTSGLFPNLSQLNNMKKYNRTPIALDLFEQNYQLEILLAYYDDSQTSEEQRSAFNYFVENSDSISREVESRIFTYYHKLRPTLVLDLGENNPKVPPCGSVTDFASKKLVVPIEIVIPSRKAQNSSSPPVLIAFHCAWDIGHGITVEIVDGRVSRIDTQDEIHPC